MSLAARGAREVDGGTEPIGDTTAADALRRRARTVWVRTIVAMAATAAVGFALRKARGE